MPFESSQTTHESSEQAAAEKRRKYIVQAMESVLFSKKKEILHNDAPIHFAVLVQRELLAKSSLENQTPVDPKAVEAFEDEYPKSMILEQAFDFFSIRDTNDFDALRNAIRKFVEEKA